MFFFFGVEIPTKEVSPGFLGSNGVFEQFGRKSFGNGPNTVSESTVSNTELSEFFGAH